MALFDDAILGNVQEKVMKEDEATSDEVVCYSHSCGSVFLALLCLIHGELVQGFEFMFTSPLVALLIMAFSVCGFIGINFTMALLERFGTVVAVTATYGAPVPALTFTDDPFRRHRHFDPCSCAGLVARR